MKQWNLNDVDALPKELNRVSASQFKNLCFKQYCIEDLYSSIEADRLYVESDGKKIYCYNPGQALQKAFLNTPWNNSAGWIVEDKANKTIWFIDEQHYQWFDSMAACQDSLYHEYDAFLIQQKNQLHYVIKDHSHDMVMRYRSYAALLARAHPENAEFPKVKKTKQKNKTELNSITTSQPWFSLSNYHTVLQNSLQIGLPFLLLLNQCQLVMARANNHYSNLQKPQQCPAQVYTNGTDFDGMRILGTVPDEKLGHVRFMGDINGDGIDDLIVAGQYPSTTGGISGSTYIVLGSPQGFPSLLVLTKLNGQNGFRIPLSNWLGWGASGVGDVNGDGLEDFALGTTIGLSNNPSTPKGGYIIFGSKEPFKPVLDLDELADGRRGFRLVGMPVRDNSHYTVINGVGDINGDGIDDLIIGVPVSSVKENYVVFGYRGNFPAIIDVTKLGEKQDGFRIKVENSPRDSQMGFSIAGAGDINDDGISDIAIGLIPYNTGSPGPGATYIIFGRREFPVVVKIDDLNGRTGFRIIGDRASDMGHSVSKAGDVNNDGIDDLIIGAVDGKAIVQAGEAYVIFGRKGDVIPEMKISEMLNRKQAVKLSREKNKDVTTGRSVSFAGDINGDNIPDIIIGSAAELKKYNGMSHVIFGQKTGFNESIQLDKLETTQGFQLLGSDEQRSSFGHSVSGGKDLNGDGKPDIAIGAPYFINQHGKATGQVYVMFGCQPNDKRLIPLLRISGLSGKQILKIVSYENNSAYSLEGSILNSFSNDLLQSTPLFFNTTQSRISRSKPFYTMLSPVNTTHFLMQYDPKIKASPFIEIKTSLFNNQGQLIQELPVFPRITDYYTHGLWSSRYHQDSFFSLMVTSRSQVETKKIHLPSQQQQQVSTIAIGHTISDRQLQFTELNSEDQMVFVYDGAKSQVWGKLLSQDAPAFLINPSNVLAHQNYFILPTLETRQFTYVALQNLTHGPFYYHRFIYDNNQLIRNTTKVLLDLSSYHQPTITTFADYSFNVVYLDFKNDTEILSQQFTQYGDKLGEPIFLTTITGKPWIENVFSTMNSDTRYTVGWHEIRNNTHQTPMQAFSRKTLWQLKPLGEYIPFRGAQIQLSLSDYFFTTLSTLNQTVSCDFKPLQREGMERLRWFSNCTMTGFIPNVANRLSFNVTVNDNYMSLNDLFSIYTPCSSQTDLGQTGFNGYQIQGMQAQEQLGHVRFLGDINGDDIDDMVVAGSEHSPLQSSYIFFGSRQGFPKQLDPMQLNGQHGFRIPFSSRFTHSIVSVGDVNGDGLQDFSVSSPLENLRYIIFGSRDAFPPVLDPETWLAANRAHGFSIRLRDGKYSTISHAGDVNNDGISDLLIGDRGISAEAYVIFGKKSFPREIDVTRLGQQGFVVYGPRRHESLFGDAVSDLGDVNGDGIDDIMICEPGKLSGGDCYVLLGRKGQRTAEFTADLDGSNGFRITNNNPVNSTQLGYAITRIDDINGDGISDIMIGAPRLNNLEQSGEIYVIFGQKAARFPQLDINTIIDGQQAFRIIGNDDPRLGSALSGMKDFDGDGRADVLIGSPQEKTFNEHQGMVYALLGRERFPATYHLNELRKGGGFTLSRSDDQLNTFFGQSVSAGGDINGDGKPDILIGVPFDKGQEQQDKAGQIYVVTGCEIQNTTDTFLRGLNVLDNHRGLQLSAKEHISAQKTQWQLLGHYLDTTQTPVQPGKLFFNGAQIKDGKLSVYNSTHFFLQSLSSNTLTIDFLTDQQATWQGNHWFSKTGNYSSHNLWTSQFKSEQLIQIGILNNATHRIIESTLFSVPEHRMLSHQQFITQRSISSQSLQRVELNARKSCLIFYDALQSQVWARRLSQDTSTNEYLLSDEHMLAHPRFFTLALDEHRFAYVAFQNKTHGPLLYHSVAYQYPELPKTTHTLWDIAPTQSLSVFPFPDGSFMAAYLNHADIITQLFSREGQTLGQPQKLWALAPELWMDSLTGQALDHRRYMLGLNVLQQGNSTIPLQTYQRNTLFQSAPLGNITRDVNALIDYSFLEKFNSTLTALRYPITCSYDILEGKGHSGSLRLGRDCTIRGTAPDIAALLRFNITINDSQTVLYDSLNLDIKTHPVEVPNLLWLWLSLGGTAALLSVTCLMGSGILCYRYFNSKNQFGRSFEATGLSERCTFKEDTLKNYISIMDNATTVTQKQAVLSLVGDIKSESPNHAFIILETIADDGKAVQVERFELYTPAMQTTNKVKKDYYELEDRLTINVDNSINDSERSSLITSGTGKHSLIKNDLKQFSVHPNNLTEQRNLKHDFFTQVIQGSEKRENCYFQSWQISMSNVKQLRQIIKQDQQRYENQGQAYSLYGKRSYLTQYMPLFFGAPGENCFDWARGKINALNIPNKIPEQWTDLVAARPVDYLPQTQGKLKYSCLF